MLKNLFRKKTKNPKKNAPNQPQNPNKTQVAGTSDDHYISIINLKPIDLTTGKKDQCYKKIEILISQKGEQIFGRDQTSPNLSIQNKCVSNPHFKIYEPSLTKQSKQKKQVFYQIEDLTDSKHKGLWKLIFGFLPWQLKKNKKHDLRHGDILFLGNPYLFLFGDSVLIRYTNPIGFPYNIRRAVKNLVLELTKTVVALSFFFLLFFTAYLAIFWQTVPGKEIPEVKSLPLIIYASDQRTSLKNLPQNRSEYIKEISAFGQYLPKVVVVSEDERFYQHQGIDPKGVLRAILSTLLGSSQGGSTLDQQVARTLYPEWIGVNLEAQLSDTILAKFATILRKLKEYPVAIKLNQNHTKDEILLAYLNSVYLGVNVNGFADASQYYFHKSVKELSLLEVTTLAAMLSKPNDYIYGSGGLCNQNINNNRQNPPFVDLVNIRAKNLDKMLKKGLISSAELAEFQDRSPVSLFDTNICNSSDSEKIFPRLDGDSLVYKELEILGYKGQRQSNLIVETTLDHDKQTIAQNLLTTFVKNNKDRNISQGALVSIDSTNGEIVALIEAVEPQEEKYKYKIREQSQCKVEQKECLKNSNNQNDKNICEQKYNECIFPITSDREECDNEENREKGTDCIKLAYNFATKEELLPGSTFKMFAYASAIEQGFSPSENRYDCKSFTFEGEDFAYSIFEETDRFYCKSENLPPTNMFTAIKVSDNLIAIKVSQDAGLNKVIEMAKRMKITSSLKNLSSDKKSNDPQPRLVLGTNPVKLIEMTSAYGILANQGERKRPHIINRVIDISDSRCDWHNYYDDSDCKIVYSYYGEAGLNPDTRGNERVLSVTTATEMTELLKTVVEDKGTASNVNISKAAGKTGTSAKAKNLWFIGYIPQDLVTGVWLGNPSFKNEDIDRTNVTSKDAARIWQDYMTQIGY